MKKKIPVILDTDIGYDCDDTWALVMLLKSPELDVKLITTETGNTTYCAKIVAKILEIAKRTDIPIGIGIDFTPRKEYERQAPWVEGYDFSNYSGIVHKNGVNAIVDTIMKSQEPITLICIGPVPNINRALEIEPKISNKTRFVGMFGSIRHAYGYKDSKTIVPEYNVKEYIKECQKVFNALWLDMVITPLDTCGLVRLTGKKYKAVHNCNEPLIKALLENYRIWAKNKKEEKFNPEIHSSILFDTVAIYLAFSDELLAMEKIGIRITDDGYTIPDKNARPINCAMKWKNLPAFEDFLSKRLVESAK